MIYSIRHYLLIETWSD